MSDWMPAQRPSEQPPVHTTLLDYEGPDAGSVPTAPTATSEPCEPDLCAAMRRMADRCGGTSPVASVHTFPARRAISHPAEWSESVPVISHGWAMSSLALPDGRRQILSFLLPGDLACTASLFEPVSGRLVEAVTEVTCHSFKRHELKSFLFTHPDLIEMLTRIWIEERKQSDQLAIDLGRRTANERIARLILNLMEQLARRGMVQNQTMEFPLRQHHIADATGLTPVHVSKVLSDFRRRGLVEISDRTLTVHDLAGLRSVAILR